MSEALETLGRFYGVMFFLSGTAKSRQFAAFKLHLRGLPLSHRAPAFWAFWVVATECFLGLLLLLCPRWHLALAATLILLLTFTLLIQQLLKAPVPSTCFCHGAEDEAVSHDTLTRNLLLLLPLPLLLGFSGPWHPQADLSALLSGLYGASLWFLFHASYILRRQQQNLKFLS